MTKGIALAVALGLSALTMNVAVAAEKKKPDKVCADGCYAHCVARVEKKLTASVRGCQNACQRSHNCNS